MRLIDVDKYCEFLNTYPLEKAQSNFMIFYRDALQYTFECEVKAIPITWIKSKVDAILNSYPDGNEETEIICKLLYEWEKENG